MLLVTCCVTWLGACQQVMSTETASEYPSPPPVTSKATDILTTWNTEFDRDLIEITDGVHVAIGYGASVFTFIEGQGGVILIDAGHTPTWSAEALVEFRKINSDPIKAIIYTHGHVDHVNGAKAFLSGSGSDTEIWARSNFNAESRTFNQSGVTINQARGLRQAGLKLPSDWRINNGVAAAVSPDRKSLLPANRVPPNRTFESAMQSITIVGVSLELVANPGETKDQLYVWYPDKRVVFAGDNFYKSWPNLYAIRGTPYRDVEEWAQAINALQAVKAEHLVGGHTRPISGADQVKETLITYHDGVRYLFEETIKGMNKGLTPNQLVDAIKLLDEYSKADILTPYYGHPDWAIRSIFNGYLGWFDGNATHLFPLSDVDEAGRIIALVGGADELWNRARLAYSDGDAQWAAQLCDYLLALNYNVPEVKNLKADALTRLAEDQITATARNYYYTYAQELRRAAKAPSK